MLKLTSNPALEVGSFEIEGLSIVENTSFALASIACRLGQEENCSTAAEHLFGTRFPAPQEVVSGSGFTVFWTGPDQYFVQAPITIFEDIEAHLKHALKQTASITEQSGGWVRLDVEGGKTIAMFERLCMIDLAATPKNRAIRTVIEHIGCFVVTREAGVSIFAPRSYAKSLFHALTVAAKSL